MFKSFGPTELIVIAILLMILFGGKKLPELGKGIGEAFKELKKLFKGDNDK